MPVPQQNAPVQQGRLINADAGKQPAQRRFVVLPVEVVIAPDFDVAGLLGIAVPLFIFVGFFTQSSALF
jgi:predicted benzoate:H+ symporter BenE